MVSTRWIPTPFRRRVAGLAFETGWLVGGLSWSGPHVHLIFHPWTFIFGPPERSSGVYRTAADHRWPESSNHHRNWHLARRMRPGDPPLRASCLALLAVWRAPPRACSFISPYTHIFEGITTKVGTIGGWTENIPAKHIAFWCINTDFMLNNMPPSYFWSPGICGQLKESCFRFWWIWQLPRVSEQ